MNYSESVIYNYNNNNNNFLFYEFYGRVRAVEVYTPDTPRTCTPPYETFPNFHMASVCHVQ